MRSSLEAVVVRFVALLGWMSGAAVFAAPSSPPAGNPALPDPAAWAVAFDKLAAADRNVSRASFDPAAVIESVGRDPAASVTWVRSNTAWAPYQGELKGAAGTLMDHAGSSLDRTLLLAELMRLSGFQVQLAHATLADNEAAELMASSHSPAAGAPGGSAATGDSDVTGRIEDQVQKIHAAIGAAARGANEDGANAARRAAADHWWVQYQQGGAWVDADPSVEPGKTARAKASETFPYVVSDGVVSLPAKYAHTIEVSLVIEVWEDDQKRLVEKPVLKVPLRAADVLGRRVMLRHHVLKSTAKPGVASDDKSIRAAALAASEWLPTLDVGGRRLAKASFGADGKVTESADLSGAAQVGGASRSQFGGLGGMMGGGGGAKAESKSAVVAEWLQFTIAAPGQAKPRIVRREVLDLIGPAARSAGLHATPQLSESQKLARALSLAGMTEILAIGCTPTPQFVAHTMAAMTLDQRGLCLRTIALPEGPERVAVARQIHPLTPILTVACLRRALSPVRDQVYLDGINVIDFRSRLVEGAGGALAAENAVDLAVNNVGILGAADPAAAFNARIAQGVADTAAESVGLSGLDPSSENTLGLLAGPAALALVAARAPSDAALTALATPDDVKARMLTDLTGGAALVLPQRLPLANSSRVGWWKVDPDGTTVGVMDNGFHSDITEDAYLNGDTVIREAGLEPTYIRPPGGPFWRQNPQRIIQLLGGDPTDMGLLEMVVDLQWQMLQSGIWL